MLEELIAIHKEVMANTSIEVRRYLYPLINWNSQAICIIGDRGVGKTTLMCQRLIEEFKSVDRALYLSADNINVMGIGLFKIAQYYFSHGGEALFIDEVHKYPDWSIEIKNIIDTYKNCKVVFSASSSVDLNQSKADLSRRVVYHHLLGLSFREFLLLDKQADFPKFTLDEILKNHSAIAEQMGSIKVLKLFNDYLSHGYYPFFLEGVQDYLLKVNNVIEKVLFEDIAVIYKLRQSTLHILKKILWLVATTDGLFPNIENMSQSLGVSREVIYSCLEYLHQSGLLQNLYYSGEGIKLVRKPGKIFLNNTNLLHAINGSLKRDSGRGGVRETFFANQVSSFYKLNLHSKADFLVEDTYTIEVGGKGKKQNQVSEIQNAYIVLDEISIGFKNKIPLYLFGFLY